MEKTFEELFVNGTNKGITLMGDNFVGFKFVGPNAEHWNNKRQLLHIQQADESYISEKWLKSENIPFVPYEHDEWDE